MVHLLAFWMITVASLVQQSSTSNCSSNSLVPALFLFGDSTVDTGNNNYLLTPAKANFPPFGYSFANHEATGRFCDGKLIPDFLAAYLGLPFPPPYMSGGYIAKGVNFASASSGIFGWTGTGFVWSLRTQVSMFRRVQFELVGTYGLRKTTELLSNSIFYICTGNNDVNDIIRVRKSALPAISRDTLLFELGSQIRRLYEWGARKFIVVSLSAVGCIPMNQVNGRCSIEGVTSSIYYNMGLSGVTSFLQENLPGIQIVTADLAATMLAVQIDPVVYGLSDANRPCCPSNDTGRWCYRNGPFCDSPEQFMYWDLVHPSEAFNRIAASKWWNGSSLYIRPMNIFELTQI